MSKKILDINISEDYDELLCLDFLAARSPWDIATAHFDGHIPCRILQLQPRLEYYHSIENIQDRYSNIYKDWSNSSPARNGESHERNNTL